MVRTDTEEPHSGPRTAPQAPEAPLARHHCPLPHRLNRSVAEGINNTIKLIERRAYGNDKEYFLRIRPPCPGNPRRTLVLWQPFVSNDIFDKRMVAARCRRMQGPKSRSQRTQQN